jgi:hypothetical protein
MARTALERCSKAEAIRRAMRSFHRIDDRRPQKMSESRADKNEDGGSSEHAAQAAAVQDEARADSVKRDTDTEQSAKIGDLQDEVKRRERSTHRLAWFGFLIAAGSLLVSSLQWWVMRSQLRDAREQYRQGGVAAAADAKESERRFNATLKQQSDAAAKQAELMAGSNQALEDAIATMQTNAAAEQGLTREGLAASRRALAVSQRARIALKEILPFSMVVSDDLQPITARFVNTGAVPATAVRYRMECEMDPETTALLKMVKQSEGFNPNARGVIAAHETNDLIYYASPLAQQQVDSFNEQMATFVCLGMVTYEDGFGQQRTTGFCLFRQAIFGGEKWLACDSENYAD